MKLIIALICLTVLCFVSSAVDVGRWTNGFPDPVPLSRPSFGYTVIQYHPEGYYLGVPPMTFYAGGMMPGNYGPQIASQVRYPRYFGFDTLLEPVDTNYPGTAFITQFLADP